MLITDQNSDLLTNKSRITKFVKSANLRTCIDFLYKNFTYSTETIKFRLNSKFKYRINMPSKVIITFKGLFIFCPTVTPTSFNFPLIFETKGA